MINPHSPQTVTEEAVIAKLNELIRVCLDSRQGFAHAENTAESEVLRRVFDDYAYQRRYFASELSTLVITMGGQPAQGGTVGGVLHRSWVNVRQALSSRDDSLLLAACEHSEDAAVAAYQSALETELPENVREVVQRQYEFVRQSHDYIRTLRDQYPR